jgi:hypothetical protein
MFEKAIRQYGLAIVLLLYVTMAMGYNIANPLHEGTDELRHYRFIRYIVVNRSLPVQGQEPCRSQSHHPPLIYAAAAALTFWVETGEDICQTPPQNPFWAYRYWEVGVDNKNQFLHGPEQAFPWRDETLAARLSRMLNTLVGAAVVYLTWAIARAIWPDKPAYALGSTAFVAFNPMFLYMSATINNDVIAALSGAAITLAGVRLLQTQAQLSRRWGFIFGGLYGLALMSKLNLAAIGLLMAVVVTYVAWRQRQWRSWLEIGLIAAGVTAVLAGWWFVRNQLLYGDPTGFRMVTELWGVRQPGESIGLVWQELPYVWTSLWGRFGFGQIPLPQIIYSGLWWLHIAAAAGWLTSLRRRGERRPTLLLLFLALNVLLFTGVLIAYMLVSPAGPMGRFFFPALPALAMLLFGGLAELVAGIAHPFKMVKRSQSLTVGTALTATVGMAILALVALFGYLAPAYARPASWSPGQVLPNATAVQFDQLVTLAGYEVSQAAVHPGEPLDITLYWEVNNQPPGNFLMFIHLTDSIGSLVAQRDTHPGLGNFPTSQWRPGDRFVERLRLWLPETAYAPETAVLSLGFYAPEGYRLAVSNGNYRPDAFRLAQIRIQGQPGDLPNTQAQNFAGQVWLRGFEFPRTAEPGGLLPVTLYWEAARSEPADFAIQLRLVNERGESVAEMVERPSPPMASWQRGQEVTESRLFTLSHDLAPGYYRLILALLRPADGQPENIIGETGHWIDNQLQLPYVYISD